MTTRAWVRGPDARAGWTGMPAAARALLGGSMVSALAALVCSGLGLARSGPAMVLTGNLGWAFAGAAALSGCLAAGLRVSQDRAVRWAWLLYAAGSTCWTAGAVVRMAMPEAGVNPVAASCWLAFAVCGIASFAVRLPRAMIFGVFLLDAVPVVLLLVAITRVLKPSPAGTSAENVAILNLYPALFGLLAANAIQMAGIHRYLRQVPGSVWLFTAGFCLMALASLIWGPVALSTGYAQGHPSDMLWTAGLLLLATAGAARSLRPGGYLDLPPVELGTGPHALPPAAALLGLIIILSVVPPVDRALVQAFLLVAAVDLFARVYLIRREDLRLVAQVVHASGVAELAAARERRSVQRLRLLADVTARMKSLLIDELLQSVCDCGREALGARFAAFGLTSAGSGAITRFVTSGLDDVAPSATSDVGGQLLDRLLAAGTDGAECPHGQPAPRLAPPGYPALEGFLGVPVVVSPTERGCLYLAGKEGGFDEEDESLVKLLATNAGHAIANAELYTESDSRREQLAASIERLRELDRMKDEFIALVSHELRTPLTSIVGYLELVAQEEAGPLSPRQRQFTNVISRNAERLLRLVDDLLFLSKIQSGTLPIKAEQVDLAEIAAHETQAARPAAERSGVRLSLSAAPVPPLAGDQTRLAQLIGNLLSNAVKFTPAGGQVSVATRTRDGNVVLEVADTGIGIPVAEQEHVFERFFRAGNAEAGAVQGTGLGLTISKAIVDAHGGAIRVISKVGAGTTFQVLLPLAGRGTPG